MPAIITAADAINTLRVWEEARPGHIPRAILKWAEEAFENEPSATANDVLRHLETIDCAACHAPDGLIYNGEIAEKLALWWSEIDDAIFEHHESMGENPAPRDGALSVGWLVWFAVEWVGYDAAVYLESEMEG
jgi:mono/diheme cytochrome c family protein